MATTIELSESQMPRPLPLPTFSAPFAAPSLRWACKKRLRCFHPEVAAAAALRLSPSFDNLRPPAPQCDNGERFDCPAVAAPLPSRPASSLSSPVPPRSPTPSDRPSKLIRIPASTREEGEWEDPLAPSCRVRGETVGWCLRSRARCSDDDMGSHKKKKKKKTAKVELWVSLSREEIEGDFLRMTGSKPPRRPRRGGSARSNHVLKGIFPASCLPTSITADRYKVPESSDSRKR